MARCLNEYGAPYNALSQEVRAATDQISHYHNFSIRYDQRSSVVLSPEALGLFACNSNPASLSETVFISAILWFPSLLTARQIPFSSVE
jgi:hypothetical protein